MRYLIALLMTLWYLNPVSASVLSEDYPKMVELVGPQNVREAEAFLSQHEESAQFLINNLMEHGPTLTDHHNSGKFKAIRQNGRIVAVFCLTRRGNLLIQSEAVDPLLILDACSKESIQLKGFIGDWHSVEPVYQCFKKQEPSYSPIFESKEILYSFDLTSNDLKIKYDSRVRCLELPDFPEWLEINSAYLSELALPDELTFDEKRRDFKSFVVNRTCWGLFEGQKLLSRTALNSKGKAVGQIGGVFTPKEFRQMGFAKAVMFHMLKDCRDIHGHTKSILFTGETDIPAQRLYESMGYKRIGSFALVLGK